MIASSVCYGTSTRVRAGGGVVEMVTTVKKKL